MPNYTYGCKIISPLSVSVLKIFKKMVPETSKNTQSNKPSIRWSTQKINDQEPSKWDWIKCNKSVGGE